MKFWGVSRTPALVPLKRVIRFPSGAIRVRTRSESLVEAMFTVTVRLLTTWLLKAGLLIGIDESITPAWFVELLKAEVGSGRRSS